MPFKKNISILLIILTFIGCINSKSLSNFNKENLVNIDTLQLDSLTIIKTHLKGFFQIDSNTVIPAYELTSENNYFKKLLESKSKFKLKSEWKNGNDSPSNGIWLSSSNDTLNNYFIINTLEGKLDIQGSSSQMVLQGISFCERLFVSDFHQNIKREKWLLPRIHIEYNYGQ